MIIPLSIIEFLFNVLDCIFLSIIIVLVRKIHGDSVILSFFSHLPPYNLIIRHIFLLLISLEILSDKYNVLNL